MRWSGRSRSRRGVPPVSALGPCERCGAEDWRVERPGLWSATVHWLGSGGPWRPEQTACGSCGERFFRGAGWVVMFGAPGPRRWTLPLRVVRAVLQTVSRERRAEPVPWLYLASAAAGGAVGAGGAVLARLADRRGGRLGSAGIHRPLPAGRGRPRPAGNGRLRPAASGRLRPAASGRLRPARDGGHPAYADRRVAARTAPRSHRRMSAGDRCRRRGRVGLGSAVGTGTGVLVCWSVFAATALRRRSTWSELRNAAEDQVTPSEPSSGVGSATPGSSGPRRSRCTGWRTGRGHAASPATAAQGPGPGSRP